MRRCARGGGRLLNVLGLGVLGLGVMSLAGPAGANAPQRHWRQAHADGSIQGAPLADWQAPPPPAWLGALGRWLEAFFKPIARLFGTLWPVVEWVLIALAVAGVGLLIWAAVRGIMARVQARKATASPDPEWAPSAQQARALLDEADQLAEQGRYDEAAHLLLLRSFDHIATSRPEWLAPSSTAREIAGLAALPLLARDAFGVVAQLVEASRYALRPLGRPEWDSARSAYASFALQRLKA